MPVSDMTQPMFLPGFVPDPPQSYTASSSEDSEDDSSPDPLTVAMSRVNLYTNRSSATQTSDSGPTPYASTTPSLRTQSEFYMTGVSPVAPSSVAAEVPVHCTICLERLATDVIKLHACGHMFHTECIIPWFDGNAPRDGYRRGTCPNCRCELYTPDSTRDPRPVVRNLPTREATWRTDVDDDGLWEDDDEVDEHGYEDYELGADGSDGESTDSETRRFDERIRALNISHPSRLSHYSFEDDPLANLDYTRISDPTTSLPETPTPSVPQTSPGTWPEEQASDVVPGDPLTQRATRIPRLIPSTLPTQDVAAPHEDSTARPEDMTDQTSNTIDLIHRGIAYQRAQLARRMQELHRSQNPPTPPQRPTRAEPGIVIPAAEAERMALSRANHELYNRRVMAQAVASGVAPDESRRQLQALIREPFLSNEQRAEMRRLARRVFGHPLEGARGEGPW